MPSLLEEAVAALRAREQAAEQAAEAERAALRAQATQALRAVLVRPDGSSLTLTQAGLSPVHTDLEAGLVVWSDGTVNVAARREEGEWRVYRLVRVDGEWTPRPPTPLTSLADLGAALLARA